MRGPGRPLLGTPKLSLLYVTRLCERCGDPYTKAENQGWARWARRKYCSTQCYQQTRMGQGRNREIHQPGDNMNRKLWEISDEMVEIGELLAEAGGVLSPELEARLDATEEALEAKVERTALYIRDLDLDADKAKAEKERLAAIERAGRKSVEGLKTYLVRCMTAAGVDRIDTHRARVRRQKSGTPAISYAGLVDDLPAGFVRVVPETRTLDKKAVAAAAKAGDKLPDGFTFAYSESVRIL